MTYAAVIHRSRGLKGVLAGTVLLALACTAEPARGQAAAAGPRERSAASVQDQGAQGGDVMQMIQECRDENAKAGRAVDETIREIDAESLENLPAGLDGAQYQWVDLDGEGLAGILTEQADGWFYKRNLSPLAAIDPADPAHTVSAAARRLMTIDPFAFRYLGYAWLYAESLLRIRRYLAIAEQVHVDHTIRVEHGTIRR